MKKDTYTFYFAGELFSHKHLLGNAALAVAIAEESKERFMPLLPQDLEFRSHEPKEIRDQDLKSLLSCDLALFHFDGPELDSGTVVEFMSAKFADIPAVILRTDFREGGDQAGEGDPWNLMCSFYPRTETVTIPSISAAEEAGQKKSLTPLSLPELKENLAAQEKALNYIAKKVIQAFEKVVAQAPLQNAVKETVISELLNISSEEGAGE